MALLGLGIGHDICLRSGSRLHHRIADGRGRLDQELTGRHDLFGVKGLAQLAPVELAFVHAERVGEFENLSVRHHAAARVDELVVGDRGVPDDLRHVFRRREVVQTDVAGLVDQRAFVLNGSCGLPGLLFEAELMVERLLPERHFRPRRPLQVLDRFQLLRVVRLHCHHGQVADLPLRVG
jgi:hypothetical protein